MRDDLIGRVSPGDKPSAERENRVADQAGAEITGIGFISEPGGAALLQRPDRDGRLPHRPNSDVPAYGVMVCNEAEDADVACILKTTKTVTLGERPVYVNDQNATSSGNIGWCRRPTNEPLYVAYDTGDGTPAAGESWGPVPDSYLVRKGFPGFCILAEGDGTNAKAVYEDGISIYYGKLDAELSPASSAQMTAYYYNGTTDATSTVTETVYCTKLLASGETAVPSGSDVWCLWRSASRHLEAVQWACTSS